MIDLKTMLLDQLILNCQAATIRYLRTHEAGDDCYCLELFRRALQEHEERAWAYIYTTYSTEEFLGEHYVLKWVRSWYNGRHGAAIRSAYTEEEIVQEVWLRFGQSHAAQAFQFDSMGQLMGYLRRLINNFMLDVARRRAPKIVEASTELEAAHVDQVIRSVPDDDVSGFDSLVVESESMYELLQQIGAQVIENERETLVFVSYFLDQLPPRRLYELHPGVFTPGEVEVIRTRLVRRLRKNPFIVSRYIQLVVLADDERLALVFQHSILDGWPDDRFLSLYSALFPAHSDLLEAKVHVVEALHRHAALLRLIHV